MKVFFKMMPCCFQKPHDCWKKDFVLAGISDCDVSKLQGVRLEGDLPTLEQVAPDNVRTKERLSTSEDVETDEDVCTKGGHRSTLLCPHHTESVSLLSSLDGC
eukprot:TRINITY_DN11761_c0_g6_i1.p3 TRINITY_DN11761_c0_g6~~TRINITY_DN11761_c0_g6_i1.p3  ORF type:complete len:103 (-),score=16.27 TRINITY_DN11761_c0_g6_i1:76-384(-)